MPSSTTRWPDPAPARQREQGFADIAEGTVDAVERYLMYAGGIAKSDQLLAMADDLATLFEQAAADGAAAQGPTRAACAAGSPRGTCWLASFSWGMPDAARA